MPHQLRDLRLPEPVELVKRWPRDLPLAALVSGKGGASASSRWSIFTCPTDVVVVDDPSVALEKIDEIARAARPARPRSGGRPFESGWMVCLSYDLGRVIEPTAFGSGLSDDRSWPALVLWRCDAILVHDALDGRWTRAGHDALQNEIGDDLEPLGAGYELDSPDIEAGEEAYRTNVDRSVELIHAGDIFQANIAHRLSSAFEGDPRALSCDLLTRSRANFGAHLEIPGGAGQLDRAVFSASPELFLSFCAMSRRVVTRPIKGTSAAHLDPGELARSEKDRAELNMIIDLMRNDLGRVCDFGSVRVVEPRAIETHAEGPGGGGVHHAVATIEGILSGGRSSADLIRAAFPAGSITGAPKVRAMQVIDEFEPVRRGPHFGSIGFISDAGDMMLNVAIRTATLHAASGSVPHHATGTLDYVVGAGIVADSEPQSEWNETLAKARILTDLMTARSAPLADVAP